MSLSVGDKTQEDKKEGGCNPIEMVRKDCKTISISNFISQARLSEVEGENARFKSMLKQKDDEMEDIDMVAKRLQEERGKVADIIRQEFADRLVAY